MCIRDRCVGFANKPLSRIFKQRFQANSPSVFQLCSVSSPCLLYTSDAADERSSVDLGGRRIIKKKTRSEQDGVEQLTHQTTQSHYTCVRNTDKITRTV